MACRYSVERGNLHHVRQQIGEALCDIDLRIEDLERFSGDYLFDNTGTTTPAVGYMSWDNTDPTLVTNIYINEVTNSAVNVGAFIASLEAGDEMLFFDVDEGQSYVYEVTGAPTVVSGVFTVPMTYLGATVGTEPADQASMNAIINRAVEWDSILNKPTAFPPEVHSHNFHSGIGPNDHHDQIHNLYGLDHGDIIQPLVAEKTRHILGYTGGGWQPEYRMNFRGTWGTGTYYTGETVVDWPYTMVANTETTDRAAPQPLGAPFWSLPEVPAWADFAQSAVIWSGHSYVFNEVCELRGIRAWVPTVSGSTNYRFVILADGVYTTIEEPVLNEDDWTLLTADTILVGPGSQLVIYIDALNTGSATQVVGGWVRGANSNTAEPPNQAWNSSNDGATIRIDFDDLDSTNRQTELESIITGSTIQFVQNGAPENSITYRVIDNPTTGVTSVIYNVETIDQGVSAPAVGNDCTMTASIPVAQSTDYVGVPDGWVGNQPPYADVTSFLAVNGVDAGADPDNQYGIDINVQRLTVSPDWDTLAISGGGGGGGGGTPFPEPPNDSLKYLREYENWVLPDTFAGPATTGYVPDPTTASGKFLSDEGTWQSVVSPPTGGLQIRYQFSTSVAEADPGTGFVSMNNADPLLVTRIYINKTNSNGNTFEILFDSMSEGDVVWYVDEANGRTYGFKVSNNIDEGAWHSFDVTQTAADNPPIGNNADIFLTLLRNPQNKLPAGGTEPQVLTKASSADYDTEWRVVDYTDLSGSPWAYSGSDIYNTNSANVGIGTASVGGKLTVSGGGADNVHINSTTSNYLRFKLNGSDTLYMGNFSSGNGFINNSVGQFTITNQSEDALQFTTTGAGSIVFRTSGTAERMRVTSTGLVGIGTNFPARRLHAKSSQQVVSVYETTNTAGLYHTFKTPTITSDTSTGFWISGADDSLNIRTNSTNRLAVTKAGNLTVNDLATGGANEMVVADTAGKLSTQPIPDSVLQGSWTPTFVRADNGANLGSPTYGTRNGRYWTLGDLCFITGYIEVNAGSTDTTVPMAIGGLPFPCNGNRNGSAIVTSSGYLGAFGAEDFISIGLVSLAGQTRMALRVVYAAAFTAYQPELGMSASFFNSGTTNRARIYFNGQYRFNS